VVPVPCLSKATALLLEFPTLGSLCLSYYPFLLLQAAVAWQNGKHHKRC
jgi:hypothetical protein